MKLLKSLQYRWKALAVYNNPLYYWWKVRKLFKLPCNLYIGRYGWNFGDRILMPKIYFTIQGLGWKTKYEDYRFEWPPYILFKFFNWCIRISFGPLDRCYPDIYWESILEYLYRYDQNLYITASNHIWNSNSETMTLLSKDLLTKKGLHKYYSDKLKCYDDIINTLYNKFKPYIKHMESFKEYLINGYLNSVLFDKGININAKYTGYDYILVNKENYDACDKKEEFLKLINDLGYEIENKL